MNVMIEPKPTSDNCILPTNSRGPLMEVHWYALYTSANREKKVAVELQRRSVEFLLPLYSSVRRWKDRRVKLELPLFPGYLFVHFALQEKVRVLKSLAWFRS
jgi:transcription antitermination factor NusG